MLNGFIRLIIEKEPTNDLSARLVCVLDIQDDLNVYKNIKKTLQGISTASYIGADKSLLSIIQRLLFNSLVEFKAENSTYKLSVNPKKNTKITIEQFINLTVVNIKPRPDPTQLNAKLTEAQQALSRFLSECLSHVLSDINRLKAIIRLEALTQNVQDKLNEMFSIGFIFFLFKGLLLEDINTEKLVANLDMLLSSSKAQKSQVSTFEKALVDYLKNSNEIDSKAETLDTLFQDLSFEKSEEDRLLIIRNVDNDKALIERIFKQIISILSNEDLANQLKQNNKLEKLIY